MRMRQMRLGQEVWWGLWREFKGVNKNVDVNDRDECRGREGGGQREVQEVQAKEAEVERKQERFYQERF